MAELPSGTVTFLFTDLEGSTRLWEAHRDAMLGALARHDEILRVAIAEHDGQIVKSTGDGFHAVFANAACAVDAAVDAQRRLGSEPWGEPGELRVRMGVHAGVAEYRGGDYPGPTVNRAARVMSVAHGGQVLVSLATAELVRDRLGDGVGLIDLGEQRLRDLSRAERLFQVRAPGLREEFPPLHSLDASPTNNLPAPVDSFVGRRGELADVLDALGDSRLVTLTGPGGSGKTRLALEAAGAALASFRDGVWFVSLAVAGNGERVVPLVAAALGVSEAAGEPVADTLEHWLGDRQLLLLLDNCEPVVGAVASFAERYLAALRRCADPGHEPRGSRGARRAGVGHTAPHRRGRSGACRVSPTPSSSSWSGRPRLLRASTPTWLTSARSRRSVAASMVFRSPSNSPRLGLRALSLEQIATRLDDRFRLLRAGERTLEAVVAWSYDLLTDAEREVFVRLAVFPADFSLEAAEMVVSDAVVEERDILDLLTRLVEKSLVTTVTTDDTYRYRLLETLREYALARLDERGEVDRWHDRLLEWAMTRVEYVEASLRRPAQDAALQSVSADAVTLRAAMNWADTRGDQLAALRIASAVPIGLVGERRQIIADLLARVGTAADGRVAGVAYMALGELAYDQGDWLAASEAITIAREHFVAAGSDRDAGWADLNGAYAAWGMGDVAEVDRLNSKAIAVFRKEADTLGLGYTLWVASLRTSDLDEAQRLAAEADELLRATGSPIGIAHNVEGRGIIAYDRDELADAAAFVAEAVELFARFGNLGCSAHALEAAAAVVGRSGRAEVATELLGAADELRRSSGVSHKPWEIRARHGDIEDRIAPLSPAAPRGRAQRGTAAHPRVRRPRRARRALDRYTRVTIRQSRERDQVMGARVLWRRSCGGGAWK